jgi:hypothetical protein
VRNNVRKIDSSQTDNSLDNLKRLSEQQMDRFTKSPMEDFNVNAAKLKDSQSMTLLFPQKMS